MQLEALQLSGEKRVSKEEGSGLRQDGGRRAVVTHRKLTGALALRERGVTDHGSDRRGARRQPDQPAPPAGLDLYETEVVGLASKQHSEAPFAGGSRRKPKRGDPVP